MYFHQWNLGRMLGFLTKQYIGHLARRMENTPIERYYYPLFIIGKHSGCITQQQLADQLLIDKVNMVRILDILSADGYIERKVNPADRREHLLFVTEKGLPWVDEIEQGLQETDALFLSLLPESQQVSFRESLLQLIEQTRNMPVEQVELFYNRTNNPHHD